MYAETNFLPSIQRWLTREKIEEPVTPVFRNASGLAVYQTINGQYIVFMRQRNTPVIGYFLVDLLPPKAAKKVKKIIEMHQQLLQDTAFKIHA
jgi:hypothetical protein